MTCPPAIRAAFGVHAVACLLLMTPLLAGCGAAGMQTNASTWQRNVEQYVNQTGGGDPVVLRDVRYKGRPAFAQIGHPVPAESTDTVGLLLGHRTIDGRPSLVYLLAIVEREKLKEMRLAVLQPVTSQGGPTQFRWLLGDSDAAALKKYRDHRRENARGAKDGDEGKADAFPDDGDRFELSVAPTVITATETSSGAAWKLPLKR